MAIDKIVADMTQHFRQRRPEHWKAYQRDWTRFTRAKKAGQSVFDSVTDYRRNQLLQRRWQ